LGHIHWLTLEPIPDFHPSVEGKINENQNYHLFFMPVFYQTCPHADSYKLAVYPSNHPQKLIVPMKIMAEYLSQESGDKFIAVVTRDYAELSERLKDKSIQLAWINPLITLK